MVNAVKIRDWWLEEKLKQGEAKSAVIRSRFRLPGKFLCHYFQVTGMSLNSNPPLFPVNSIAINFSNLVAGSILLNSNIAFTGTSVYTFPLELPLPIWISLL